MKKILIFIFGILLLSSCNTTPQNAIEGKTSKTEYLYINGCRYYKIKICNHEVYQYTFSTYTGTGSDIIHFNDMCEYCRTNNK